MPPSILKNPPPRALDRIQHLNQLLLRTSLGSLLLEARDKLSLVRASLTQAEAVGTISNDILSTKLITKICLPEMVFIDIGSHVGSIISEVQKYNSSIKIIGVEALLRWQHPTRGLVLPKQFILLAEKHNLMNLLTEEVLHLVIKDYKIISDNNLNVMVSINLSAQNINDLSKPEKLEALVKHYGIEPESFMLEINESALMNEVTESLDIFNRLRMKGFSLSIDDQELSLNHDLVFQHYLLLYNQEHPVYIKHL